MDYLKISNMKKTIKLYSLDYLANNELSEEDLLNLLDNKCLLYSIIIDMFNYANIKKTNKDIISFIRKDPYWMEKYTWSKQILDIFENKLIKALQNIYCYDLNTATQKAMWYMTIYGFKVNGNKIDL